MGMNRMISGKGRRGLCACAGALLLAGCAAAPPTTYDLHAATAPGRAMRASVAVETPLAAAPLDRDLIVVRESEDRLSSLAGAQWADTPAYLIRSRLVETFENAGLLRNLRRSGEPASYRLVLELRRFDIDAATREARVEIAAQLTHDGGSVTAAKIFSAAEPVVEIAGAAPPQALDRALGRVLPQIVAWTAGR
jgi:cholesterol transport system auxiliary component